LVEYIESPGTKLQADAITDFRVVEQRQNPTL